MLANILSGGKGTRLAPFTMTIPKPLLPLGDMPILEVVIRQLKSSGVDRIVLTLNHMSHLFTALFGDGSKIGIQIDHYIEDEPLGTAGSLRHVSGLEDNFIVMNGDILTTFDYRELFDFHVNNQSMGTIGATYRESKIDFGVIETDGSNRLINYLEKPSDKYKVSMGINVLNRKCLDYIPEGVKFDMPDLMMAMKNDGQNVFCYAKECYWQDIGRFDDFQRASEDFIREPKKFLKQV